MNNILFDGNYILYKNVFTLFKMNMLYGELWNALDNNISKYTSMNTWDNVIFISDSNKKSWRSKYLKKYKGTRQKNEDIDWNWVFETYNDWKDSIREKYVVLERDHIEGDDFITSVILRMNKKKKSNVVISSDQDLYQLINYHIDGKNSWINIQINDINGKETVQLPEGWEIWLKEFTENQNQDVFALDNRSANLDFFNRITSNWNYNEINSSEELFKKLVQGDKSDNISSIYQTLTTTGKIQNIGKGGAENVWKFYKDNYSIHFDTTDKTFIMDVVKCLENVKNVEFEDETRKTVSSNVRNNIKLIELHYRHYPEWVLEEIMDAMSEYNL